MYEIYHIPSFGLFHVGLVGFCGFYKLSQSFAHILERFDQTFGQLLHALFHSPVQRISHFLEVLVSLSKCSAPLFEVLVGTGFRFSGFLFGSGFLVGVVGFVFGGGLW